ncbi:MAG: glutamine synthetase III [Lentisphaeria bacterium]|nr:glutamine synthetase III [Lentisphaeria bacterium]
MNNANRQFAINNIARAVVAPAMSAEPADINYYGEDVFSIPVMQQFMPKESAEKLLATIERGKPLDQEIADDVANAMKEWALSRGATHFTHWFQPLTGGTAEKHDSFLEAAGTARAILKFSGKNLIVGESDASSFPSGGLRCTFEARGYTAWDPTSPAFIKRHSNGATLCIPTIFCSYTGEALDKKTPLLRSIQSLGRALDRLMKCFGKEEAQTKVTLGAEQEYFLIDKKFYMQRTDLIQTGRTLFGAPPPKHQQLEDHYFGAIRPRIISFMTEVEKELWKLGIPARTRHNEVAPAQFELAPMFEELNLAVDHNMLVMEVLRQTADRHGLVCLFHEKPFRKVNGSGKHNNWAVDYGNIRLLDPGKDPSQNAIFLTMLCAVIRAVDIHGDLLRAATACAGNEHRLGASEAPPAIISIFLGNELTEVIDQLAGLAPEDHSRKNKIKIGVDTLPSLPKDATDRNRTSPFAFTGNKFEFRAPGASQSCSGVSMILNTIVTESVDYLASRLENVPKDEFNNALQSLLKEVILEHRRIIFNGDNYSVAWVEEAKRRGLPNTPGAIEALKALKSEKAQELFRKYGVLHSSEIISRHDVFVEEYHRKIRIEGEVALEMVRSQIYPAALNEFARASAALESAKNNALKHGITALEETAETLGRLLDELYRGCRELESALSDSHEKITAAHHKLRLTVDELELVMDDSSWPLPKYREMLFVY